MGSKACSENKAQLTLLDVVEKPPTWAGYKLEELHLEDIEARTQRLEKAAEPYR